MDVLLVAFEILPYEELAAHCFGQIKASLELAGEKIDDLDLQIASTVLTNGCTLITHNQKYFVRLAARFDFLLDDWL